MINIIEKKRIHKEHAKSVFLDHVGFFMKSKYSAEEKFQIVMENFEDNVIQAERSRRHDIYLVQLRKCREQFILSGKSALVQKRNSDSRDEEIDDLKKIIGELSLMINAFKKVYRGGQYDSSWGPERSDSSQGDLENIWNLIAGNYYRPKKHIQRLDHITIERIKNTASEKSTYGYKRGDG